jgi:hypothetical protein
MKVRHAHIYAALIVLSATWPQESSVVAQTRREEPETVMITLRAKAGAEAELAQVIARHWDTAQRLKLVTNAPHVTLRGTEAADGAMRTFFVDVFTWRDASIPDAAPKEILAIWADLNRLVEKRNGRAGLTIDEVALVAK